jgi:PAS domain S-box-containing protein
VREGGLIASDEIAVSRRLTVESLAGALFDRFPDAVIIAVEGGAIVYANAAAVRLAGGPLCGAALRLDDRDAENAAILAALGESGRWTGDSRIRRADGTTLVAPASVAAAEIDGARCLVCVRRLPAEAGDDRPAKTAPDAARRFRALADSAPALIWTADPRGTITFVNARWRRYAGAPADGPPKDVLAIVHPADRARRAEAWAQALREGTEFEIEVRKRRADGEYRWFLSRATPTRDETGAIVEWCGFATDIHDRKLVEERQQLLTDELNHRVKNTLAVVQSLAQQTFRRESDPEAARRAFEGRLVALAGTHTLLTHSHWRSTSMRELALQSAEAAGEARRRVRLSGPDVVLSPRQALSIAMALHELCTNAVKYGSLSTEEGRVDLSWSTRAQAGALWLDIAWRERGGPPVTPPRRRGFGSYLLERVMAHDLGGGSRLDYRKEGLVAEFSARLSDRSDPPLSKDRE